MNISIPPLLKSGDKIGIVAPGRKPGRASIDTAITVFESWGLEATLGANLFTETHNYLSASDEQRLADLQRFFDDDKIRAVICARGGYGSSRIIDYLDLSQLIKYPKWLIGFSDVTAIHLLLFRAAIASIHGTMPILFPKEETRSSLESLRALLFEGECHIDIPRNAEYSASDITGFTVGGNLSLIVDSLGTKTELDTTEKILVVEEIDEYYYRLDRMIHQLDRAGKLKNLRALVVGYMTDMKEGDLRFGASSEDIIRNVVGKYDYPVFFNFPIGHENPNLAWIHGGLGTLKSRNNRITLSYGSIKANT